MGTSALIQFGLFELDLQSRELRKSGIKVKLQDQPFEILAMLLERPGEIVTREELQKRLWPADTFVDFDLSLNSAVKKLRQALNDDSDNPRFVETLYRRGYRFIGPFNGGKISADQVLTSPISEPAVGVTSRDSSERKRLLLLAGLLAIFAIAAWLMFVPRRSARVLGYTQITHDGRAKADVGTHTTDGERLYFTEMDGDRFVISQVSATGGETAILPTPFTNVGAGGIAPDGSALLVSNFKGTGSPGLWSLPLPAGPPRRLADFVPNSATWSPDGNQMAYSKGHEIYLAKSDATDPHKLATAGADVMNLKFSPDGKRLRFDAYDSRRASMEIWEVMHDGSGMHPLLLGWNSSPQECCGNWTPDGKYYVFQSFQKGSTNIWALPEKSNWPIRYPKPIQLTNGPLNFSVPVPSKDGKKIFAIGSQPRSEFLRLDPKVGLIPFLANLSASDLAFSPDGQWVAYAAVPGRSLWRSRIDGSQPLQLTSSSMFAALPRWSPDGKQLVFMGRTANTNYRPYLVSANAGNLQELMPGQEIGFDPGWSPDGKSIVLSLDEAEHGAVGISILNLESKILSRVPASENYFSPRWSPDGKYIAAISKDMDRVALFDVSRQRWTDVGTAPSGVIGYPSWSHDGQYLYFDTVFTDDPDFFRIRISDHQMEKVQSLKGLRRFLGEFGPWSGLAPDDSLVIAHDLSNQEIYALDWLAP